jgi:hypothetical protein
MDCKIILVLVFTALILGKFILIFNLLLNLIKILVKNILALSVRNTEGIKCFMCDSLVDTNCLDSFSRSKMSKYSTDCPVSSNCCVVSFKVILIKIIIVLYYLF